MQTRRTARSSSVDRGRGQAIEDGDGVNPFLSDATSGGSGGPTGTQQAVSSTNRSQVVPAPQREREHGEASIAHASLVHQSGEGSATLDPHRQLDLTTQSRRQQGDRAATVLPVPPGAQVQQLLSGGGVYHFDADAFQRFLEYEKLQRMTRAMPDETQPRSSEP